MSFKDLYQSIPLISSYERIKIDITTLLVALEAKDTLRQLFDVCHTTNETNDISDTMYPRTFEPNVTFKNAGSLLLKTSSFVIDDRGNINFFKYHNIWSKFAKSVH